MILIVNPVRFLELNKFKYKFSCWGIILLPTVYFGVYISIFGSNCIGRHFISRYDVFYNINITLPENTELYLHSALPIFPTILVTAVILEFTTIIIHNIRIKRRKSRKIGIINETNLDTTEDNKSTSYSFITYLVIINLMIVICSNVLVFINEGTLKVIFKHIGKFTYRLLIQVIPLAWICKMKPVKEYVIHKLYQFKIRIIF